MVRRYIYKTRCTEHPQLPILRYEQGPTGNRFTEALHGILPGKVPGLRYVYVYAHSPADTMITVSTLPLRQYPKHCRVRYTTLEPSLTAVSNCIWLTFYDWIWLTFYDLIWLSVFDSIWLSSLPIQFDSRLTWLFLIIFTSFESQSIKASGSTTLARVSSKYSNIEIVEYSTILRT